MGTRLDALLGAELRPLIGTTARIAAEPDGRGRTPHGGTGWLYRQRREEGESGINPGDSGADGLLIGFRHP
ncbi:hypothetical protein NOK12_29910 [Nocardioides sp. OK12]|nr:hypothetical protein NOK12_29910 [Nocardioides sp. OK12]